MMATSEANVWGRFSSLGPSIYDVLTEGRGSGSCGRLRTGDGVKNRNFFGCHKWMTP